MVWSCVVGHRESFRLARVQINKVWISEGLLYFTIGCISILSTVITMSF